MTSIDIKNGLIGTIFGKVAYQAPATWYLGISTTPLQSNGTGFTEPPASSGYARVAVPNNPANWTAAANGSVSNKLDIKMPEISVDSGIATHYFLSDSLYGNAKVWGALTETRPLVSHSSLTFLSGEAKFSFKDESV